MPLICVPFTFHIPESILPGIAGNIYKAVYHQDYIMVSGDTMQKITMGNYDKKLWGLLGHV